MATRAGRVLVATAASLFALNGCETSTKLGDCSNPKPRASRTCLHPRGRTGLDGQRAIPDFQPDAVPKACLERTPTTISVSARNTSGPRTLGLRNGISAARSSCIRATSNPGSDLRLPTIGCAVSDLADRAYDQAMKIAGPRPKSSTTSAIRSCCAATIAGRAKRCCRHKRKIPAILHQKQSRIAGGEFPQRKGDPVDRRQRRTTDDGRRTTDDGRRIAGFASLFFRRRSSVVRQVTQFILGQALGRALSYLSSVVCRPSSEGCPMFESFRKFLAEFRRGASSLHISSTMITGLRRRAAGLMRPQ